MAIGVVVGIFAVVWAVLPWSSENPGQFSMRLWMAGAGALGLVSGFITGFSSSSDSGKAFTTFISTGLLVPILGGVAALLGDTEKVTEKTTYLNSNIVEKTTETVSSISDNLLHPLAVLGSFFLAFGVLAILGIIAAKLL
jgi:vacuolar-type H+-ATPase subunit I/STV1